VLRGKKRMSAERAEDFFFPPLPAVMSCCIMQFPGEIRNRG